VDYDEIERRMHRVLEERLGGGYSTPERLRLLQALEVFIVMWEDGTLEPPPGLSLEATRQLAEKVMPEDLAEEEHDGERNTESTTARGGDENAGNGDPSTFGYDHGPAGGVDDSAVPDTADDALPRIVVRREGTAPQFVDADPGGDEGGQDDAAGDGR
jgi:hypothetical protein